MIIRTRMCEGDGRQEWTLESWQAETNKPVHLLHLTSVIEMGLDPFRECVGGINADGRPAAEAACDRYPLIGESQCRACKNGVCGLCNRNNPSPFPHGRLVCTECAESIRSRVGAFRIRVLSDSREDER